jgi:hypothetical protein
MKVVPVTGAVKLITVEENIQYGYRLESCLNIFPSLAGKWVLLYGKRPFTSVIDYDHHVIVFDYYYTDTKTLIEAKRDLPELFI